MNKLEKINIDELCFEESGFLKSVYNDLNNEVDELNIVNVKQDKSLFNMEESNAYV